MPNGIFELDNSDRTVSSYYKISDVVTMINNRLRADSQITEDYLRENFINFIQEIDETEVIEEIIGFREIWNSADIRERKLRPHNVQNHYELVLYNIFIRVVGENNVQTQFQINGQRHRYDFMVKFDGQKYLIEFEGIGHYRPNRGNIPNIPVMQLDDFENTEYKLILWPYWIQRCELNLKVILGLEINGLGAIWSSDYHFGEFPWENSYDIINTLNAQFNIERNNEIGYVYGPETEERNNPENPVVENILNPNRPAWTRERRLIPNGTPDDMVYYWLPDRLKE